MGQRCGPCGATPRRAAVSVAALGAVGIGLLLGGAAWPPTAAAASSASRAVVVVATPCGAPPGSPAAACTADPTSLAVAWPIGDSVAGVSLAWNGAGRPAAAPTPATPTQGLSVANGTCTTSITADTSSCTWAWPASVRLPAGGQLLNGSYQVTACSNDPTVATTGSGPEGCTATTGLGPATVAVGVAPTAPAGVTSTGGSTVTLRWTRSNNPDLAGYRVARDGKAIWSCAADGAGGSATTCPAGPQVADTPTAGHHTYSVTALAFGPTATSPLLVSSPSSAAVTVSPAAAGGAGGGGAGSGVAGSAAGNAAVIALGPVPYVGPAVTLPPAAVPGGPATALAPAPDRGFAPTLPYKAGGAPSALPLASDPSASREAGAGTSTATLDRTALFALGMLILAIAAHLVFLKSEMARREALWRGFREAAGLGPPARMAAAGTAPASRSQRVSTPDRVRVPALESVMLWRPGANRHHPRRLRG